MRSFTIGENDATQRLDRFLQKALPELPTSLMYKYIRTRKIRINNKRAKPDNRLKLGDEVVLYIHDDFFTQSNSLEFLDVPKSISVVYEDENILIVDKPVGLLSQPNKSSSDDSMVSRIKHYLYSNKEFKPEKEASFAPALVNRLDRNTGGLVIAAKNAASLRVLNQKMKDRKIKRMYLCVAEGIFSKKADELTAYLLKDRNKNTVSILQDETLGSQEVKTRYKVLETRQRLSLLEVELITGRSHQIRAHLASIGHPLVGDRKYGGHASSLLGSKGQALYAYCVSFNFSDDTHLAYLNKKSYMAYNIDFYNKFLKL